MCDKDREEKELEEEKHDIRLYPDDDPLVNLRWYAAYTRPHHEKKVYTLLEEKNIHSYLPLVKEYRRWSDRKKWVEEPLIRGYIFVNIKLTNTLYVLETDGVVRFVTFNKEYAAIPDFQIEALQRANSSDYKLTPSKYLGIGQPVEIVSGPLKGVVGRVESIYNREKFVISLDAIQASFTVNLDPSLIKPVSKSKKIDLPLGFK